MYSVQCIVYSVYCTALYFLLRYAPYCTDYCTARESVYYSLHRCTSLLHYTAHCTQLYIALTSYMQWILVTSVKYSVMADTGWDHYDFNCSNLTSDCAWNWVKLGQSGCSRPGSIIDNNFTNQQGLGVICRAKNPSYGRPLDLSTSADSSTKT